MNIKNNTTKNEMTDHPAADNSMIDNMTADSTAAGNETFNLLEQKEPVQHGDVLFPIREYHTSLPETYPYIISHWHEEMELTKITEGIGRYQINLIDYTVKAGDIILIQPMLLHAVTQIDRQTMRTETFVFHLNFLGAGTRDLCSMKYIVPIASRDYLLPVVIHPEDAVYPFINDAFEKLLRSYREERFGYELEMKILLLQVFRALFESGLIAKRRISASADASTDNLKTVMTYIRDHYADHLTVSELAGLCYFSEYHFMRFFKKHIGMTCIEYINNIRLTKAAEAFEQGEDSILGVSLSVGFNSLSYFHKQFKQKYNTTPKQFLETVRESREL